jgi:hypothetical protein
MFTAVTGSLVCVQPAQAYTVTLQQVGANVVATGSGAIDLTGLNFGGTLTNGQALIAASEAQIFTGPTSLTSFDLYTGLSGPRAFGQCDFFQPRRDARHLCMDVGDWVTEPELYAHHRTGRDVVSW